jgi:transcriptional regulator with XRE-family HTH domain
MNNKPLGGRRRRRKSDKPNPIDVHVGTRVRLRRTLLGMSQEKLGDALGLTFQQVQKYERGANRIGASRLYDLSRVLDVPVSFFFDDIKAETVEASQGEPGGRDDAARDARAGARLLPHPRHADPPPTVRSHQGDRQRLRHSGLTQAVAGS